MNARSWLAASLVAIGVAGAPAGAEACGALVSRDGSAELNSFTALLAWEAGNEELLVTIAYQSNQEFGWLLPLPAAPVVTAGNSVGLRRALVISTPPAPPHHGFGFGAAAPPGPTELGRATVGGYELVTLGGGDAQSVGHWLTDHGFAFHDRQAAAVQSYLDRHWVLEAARVAPGALAGPAQLTPVHLSFRTPEPVYPLLIAGSGHATAIPMTLLVVTPFRPRSTTFAQTVVKPDAYGQFPAAGDRLELRYSAPLDADERTTVMASVHVAAGSWLTRYQASWSPATLSSDLILDVDPSQSRVDFSDLMAAYRRAEDDSNRQLLLWLGFVIGVPALLGSIFIIALTVVIVYLVTTPPAAARR
ncbi:MAG TPA: DUF2330 domain-containing protein [Candidatus Acidoferrales bacterium]|nr:DUF2330 domain-containing protein [Candidatus Acidoferrales bacterium]